MEHLHNGFTLQTVPGTFPLSTDSILLSRFAKLPKNAAVLDLGSGCGTLGMLLCAEDAACSVTGVELDPTAHAAALENIQRNALAQRLFSICGDICAIPQLFPAGSFSCCISNPPYFSGGPASKATPQARRDDHCSIETLFQSAAWALRWGGDFFIVHKPENLARLCATASSAGLEPKRLCLVRHNPEQKVNLILLSCRKGAKPGLVWEDLVLFDRDGQPTPAYREIYHL